MQYLPSLLAASGLFSFLVEAQLSGTVGPLTSIDQKRAVKECNVLDYGVKVDSQIDLGPALNGAFAACAGGGVVVIPEGNYYMATWVTLAHGNAWALQLDGVINRSGTEGGNMIMIEHSNDFEMFSTTAEGAIQGRGYVMHQQNSITGPRLLRMWDVSDYSVHDLALVDSPSFHFTMEACSNGEVYNMAIRGANHGGLDGIDVFSNNVHIHDVMVTNKDECVTVKSPASNLLIENIYCNWSGGCSFGSLGSDTAISNVVYRNVYSVNCNYMIFIKSNGGSGSVSDVVLENFIGHNNAYNIDVDQYWDDQTTAEGDGVYLNNITFSNWQGTTAAGSDRPQMNFNCADGAPCHDMTLSNVNLVGDDGSTGESYCRSAYGDGGCLSKGHGDSYAGISTDANIGKVDPPTMAQDLTTDFGWTVPIPIPTVGPSFFPGVAPISAIAGGC